jgi:hypothetical protein
VKFLSAAPNNLKDDLTRYTRQVWQPRLGRDLNCEDLRQITENLTGFFTVLAEWSRTEGATAADENDARLSTNLIVNEEQPIGGDRGGRGGVSRCGDERHRLVPFDDALSTVPANVFLVVPPKRSLHTPRKLGTNSKA